VLFDHVAINLAEGMSPYQAVVESAVSRRKPVLKAAATTVFAFVPLLLDTFWESVAVTIMFGLAFATISSHGGGTGALCDPVSHSSAEICLRTCFMNWMSSSESGMRDPFPRDCPTALRANGPHPFTFLPGGKLAAVMASDFTAAPRTDSSVELRGKDAKTGGARPSCSPVFIAWARRAY
jgi:hypothetical protein